MANNETVRLERDVERIQDITRMVKNLETFTANDERLTAVKQSVGELKDHIIKRLGEVRYEEVLNRPKAGPAKDANQN